MADYSIEVSIPNQGPAGPPAPEVPTVARSVAKNIVNNYRANIIANSGTISTQHLNALATYLDSLVSSTAWPKIKELWLPMGDQLAAMLVKLKYLAALSAVTTHDNLVEGDYVPTVGLTGGTNRRLKSAFNPNTHFSSALSGMGVFTLVENWETSGVLAGSTSGLSYFLNIATVGRLGNYTISSGAGHPQGRGLQWMQFRSSNFEAGTAGRITFSAPSAAALNNDTFNLFSAGGGFYSNPTVGGYVLFEAMTPQELRSVDLFFKRVNAAVGRDPYAPSVNFIGDSITSGVGASAEATRWVNLFANKYGLAINNQGLTGYTLKAPQYPGPWGVYPLTLNLYNKPSTFYVIFIGTNDAYNYDAPSTHLQDFESAYRTMLNTLVSDGVDLASQAILVSPSWPADAALINGVTRARYESYVSTVAALASEYGVPYVDAYATILAAGGAAALDDQIHPNDVGHAAIAAAVGAAFEGRETFLPQTV
jgi:lysophospholipase L1-like esterase